MTKYFENWYRKTYEECVKNPNVHCYVDGADLTTTIFNYKTKKVGVAKCRPNDQFYRDIGIAIAYARCCGLEVPAMDYEPKEKTVEVSKKRFKQLAYFLNGIAFHCLDCPAYKYCCDEEGGYGKTCRETVYDWMIGKGDNK